MEKNGRLSQEHFTSVDDFIAHAKGKTLYAQDLYGGADRRCRIKVHVYNELAWHSMFIRALLIRPDRAELSHYVPDFTILSLSVLQKQMQRHGVRSETIIAIDFTRRIVLIGGTSYAAMKKSVFTTLNSTYEPSASCQCIARPMSAPTATSRSSSACQARGTGQTTLSANPKRTLIGDDEHGWGPHGVLQFRGRLLREMHPALARGGAECTPHAPLRDGAGERRD